MFTLLLGMVAPYAQLQAAEIISVAEAIENNSGDETVEGYIVGHVISSSSVNQEAPFSNDYNYALADSPDETNMANMLLVQLPAEFRGEFGLQANPSLVGTKVEVSGSLEAYYGAPGLKSPTSMTVVEGDTAPDPEQPTEPELMTIKEAKGQSGQTVIIEGVVTADNAAIGGGSLSTYVQDETGGINVFEFSPDGFPNLTAGQKIRVEGSITEYNGLTEIVPVEGGIEILAENVSLPDSKTITLAELMTAETAEPLEGTLVKVNGYVSSKPSSPAGGGYNVTIIDEDYNGTTLRVMEGTNAIDSIEEGRWYDFTAIVSQYNSYQLLVRSADDIIEADSQPEAPDPSGEYVATVARVVDGDTINVVEPILGSTSVRFLNIDTPETFHSVRNDLDQNQMDHGQRATAYMGELLQPGDKVRVKVGAEPLDNYGRLLAQVIRDEDGLNTNLEMVKQGLAVTYFIWPVGDEAEYEQYQSAVLEAKETEKGIWNPADPLAELPFVFRTRYEGDELDKYVGNSDTKEYVAPQDWESVPVEKRVFFWDTAQAASAGYTAAAGVTPEPTPDDEVVSITKAREATPGEVVTIEGTVTTTPGSWGAKGFYLQDEDAGLYIYQSDFDVAAGDVIRMTGTRDEFNGEVQLSNVTALEVIGQESVPAPQSVTPAQVADAQGEVVALEGVTISNITELAYGTVEFTATQGEEDIIVRIDNRTGFAYDQFSTLYEAGDVVDVTGMGSVFQGAYQVKPRGAEDVKLAEQETNTALSFATKVVKDTKKQQWVEVAITAEDAADLQALSFDLNFNDKPVKFKKANAAKGWSKPELGREKGSVSFLGYAEGTQAVDGNTLYTIEFQVKKDEVASTNVVVSNIILASATGEEQQLEDIEVPLLAEGSAEPGPANAYDLNGDGVVSTGDVARLAAYMGKEKSDNNWEEASKADFDKDGKITYKDMKKLLDERKKAS